MSVASVRALSSFMVVPPVAAMAFMGLILAFLLVSSIGAQLLCQQGARIIEVAPDSGSVPRADPIL